jgi:hypothetical protein
MIFSPTQNRVLKGLVFSLLFGFLSPVWAQNSVQLDALDDWTRQQRLPVFRLRCACQQAKCIDEICD